MSCTRLPKCSDGAVGSNPQYAVTGPSASAVRSADSSVVCAHQSPPLQLVEDVAHWSFFGRALRRPGRAGAQPATPPRPPWAPPAVRTGRMPQPRLRPWVSRARRRARRT